MALLTVTVFVIQLTVVCLANFPCKHFPIGPFGCQIGPRPGFFPMGQFGGKMEQQHGHFFHHFFSFKSKMPHPPFFGGPNRPLLPPRPFMRGITFKGKWGAGPILPNPPHPPHPLHPPLIPLPLPMLRYLPRFPPLLTQLVPIPVERIKKDSVSVNVGVGVGVGDHSSSGVAVNGKRVGVSVGVGVGGASRKNTRFGLGVGIGVGGSSHGRGNGDGVGVGIGDGGTRMRNTGVGVGIGVGGSSHGRGNGFGVGVGIADGGTRMRNTGVGVGIGVGGSSHGRGNGVGVGVGIGVGGTRRNSNFGMGVGIGASQSSHGIGNSVGFSLGIGGASRRNTGIGVGVGIGGAGHLNGRGKGVGVGIGIGNPGGRLGTGATDNGFPHIGFGTGNGIGEGTWSSNRGSGRGIGIGIGVGNSGDLGIGVTTANGQGSGLGTNLGLGIGTSSVGPGIGLGNGIWGRNDVNRQSGQAIGLGIGSSLFRRPIGFTTDRFGVDMGMRNFRGSSGVGALGSRSPGLRTGAGNTGIGTPVFGRLPRLGSGLGLGIGVGRSVGMPRTNMLGTSFNRPNVWGPGIRSGIDGGPGITDRGTGSRIGIGIGIGTRSGTGLGVSAGGGPGTDSRFGHGFKYPVASVPVFWGDGSPDPTTGMGIGVRGPGIGSLGPGMERLGPGIGSLGPGIGSLGPGIGSLGPGIGSLGPGIGSLGPGIGSLGPGLGVPGIGGPDIGPPYIGYPAFRGSLIDRPEMGNGIVRAVGDRNGFDIGKLGVPDYAERNIGFGVPGILGDTGIGIPQIGRPGMTVGIGGGMKSSVGVDPGRPVIGIGSDGGPGFREPAYRIMGLSGPDIGNGFGFASGKRPGTSGFGPGALLQGINDIRTGIGSPGMGASFGSGFGSPVIGPTDGPTYREIGGSGLAIEHGGTGVGSGLGVGIGGPTFSLAHRDTGLALQNGIVNNIGSAGILQNNDQGFSGSRIGGFGTGAALVPGNGGSIGSSGIGRKAKNIIPMGGPSINVIGPIGGMSSTNFGIRQGGDLNQNFVGNDRGNVMGIGMNPTSFGGNQFGPNLATGGGFGTLSARQISRQAGGMSSGGMGSIFGSPVGGAGGLGASGSFLSGNGGAGSLGGHGSSLGHSFHQRRSNNTTNNIIIGKGAEVSENTLFGKSGLRTFF